MQFGRTHKLTTYLAVWCAFFALILSDELPQPTVLLCVAGILISWWWEPPRVNLERWSWLFTGLAYWVILGAILALIYRPTTK